MLIKAPMMARPPQMKHSTAAAVTIPGLAGAIGPYPAGTPAYAGCGG
jgi:hypothetical protein